MTCYKYFQTAIFQPIGIWLQDWVGLQHSWDGDRLIWNWELNMDHYPGEQHSFVLLWCCGVDACCDLILCVVMIVQVLAATALHGVLQKKHVTSLLLTKFLNTYSTLNIFISRLE